MAEWHKLTKRDLPPVDNMTDFLLWRGINEDGGFPVCAKRVQYGGEKPYIRYCTPFGWKILDDTDFRGCMWTEIEPPEEARKMWAKTAWNRRNEQ